MNIYNLDNEQSIKNAKEKIDRLAFAKKKVEIKEYKKTRSNLQNSALHLFFTILCNQLNEIGQEFHYTGLKGKELTTRWTSFLVKEMIWRPIQITLYGIESTTKINTIQINEILDILIKHFGQFGLPVSFPNRFDQYLNQISKQYE